MAIRLASAIGQQREPIGIFGGVDDAINKTGDAIQAANKEKRDAAAKKKDQEQKYKDIVASNLQTRSLEGVSTKDWEEDQNYQKEGIARALALSADPNTTKSQLDKELRDFDEELKKREHLYKRDFRVIGSVAKKQDTHNTSLFDDFLFKGPNPSQVSDMPNDDFMAASEMNKAGTLPSENLPSSQGALQNLPNDPNIQGELILLPNDPNFQEKLEELSKNPNLRGIEQSDGSVRVINKGVSEGNKMNEMFRTEKTPSYQGVPYLNKSIDERLKIDIDAKENELTTLKKPNIVKAVQGYEGPDFKFGSLTKATTKISPTTGEIIYEFDEEKADNIGRRFASSMVGDGNFGDKNHEQYQRGLEYEALRAGNEAGLNGDNLANFVQETVQKMAYDDFMQNARAAEMERTKNDREVTKAPSKGMTFNNNLGGGGSETPDGVFIPKETPLLSDDELKSYVKEKDAERYGRWRTEYNNMHENDKEKKEESEIKEIHKRELSKPSKNNPNLTIQQWNEQQARKEADNAKMGLTAISFTPKGKDNWFSAKTNDGVTRKIIPKTIYKNDRGELVKVEGYNVDESTDEVKIDLEEFEVDTKNEANRNSFIGKYPTSIEAAEINMPTKVVVSGKQGVGTIQGKRAAVPKEVPTIKSEAEFNKLPKGAKFYNSKGVLKTKG